MTALTTAYMLGARVIEKHFTHDKSLPGNDHYHAMDVERSPAICVRMFGRIESLIGSGRSEGADRDRGNFATQCAAEHRARCRRSLPESVLTEAMLTYKRPGTGVSPLHWDAVIGRKVARDLERDHVLSGKTWPDQAGSMTSDTDIHGLGRTNNKDLKN